VPFRRTTLSVSVETTQDDVYEGEETFQLEATTESGASDKRNADRRRGRQLHRSGGYYHAEREC
ncbi:hypothetical protein, partial [Halomonas sp. QHL1]|uniref:hypothetical protein n=1 Tax=Halomonas sp. QHL1 TaxID=1123773 RepID=UPI001C313FC2